MSAITDGTFTSAVQHGSKKLAFPFQSLGDKYAQRITREYVMLASSYVAPAVADRTSYTNHALRSEDFDSAGWTETETTATDAAAANPIDGATTASTLLETTANATHYISQTFTFTAVEHNFTCYVKPNGRSWVKLHMYDGTTTHYKWFDVTSGALGSGSAPLTSGLFSCGGGWYRCRIKATPLAAAGSFGIEISNDGSGSAYAGDVTKGLYIFGAQLERANNNGPYVVTTTAARTVSVPNVDYVDNQTFDTVDGLTADQNAFLVDETEIDVSAPGVARFSRSYARIPATQTDYTSRAFHRPEMHDIFSGTTYAVSYDDGKTSTLHSARKTVSSVGAITLPATPTSKPAETIGALNADTFTLIDSAGNTSGAIAMNTAPDSIQNTLNTALGALGQVTAAGTTDVLRISWDTGALRSAATSSTNVTMDVDGTSVVFRAIKAASGNPEAVRVITTSSAHSGAAGELAAFWNGDKLVSAEKVIAVGSDTITVQAADGPMAIGSTAITHCQFFDQSATRYANGVVTATCKRVRDFYLPGFTTGITTAADIPLVTVAADPVSWLAAIVAGTAFVPIEVSDLGIWEGPIYVREQLQIQMSDALDTVTAGA